MGRLISFNTAMKKTGVSRRQLLRLVEKHSVNMPQFPGKGIVRSFFDEDDIDKMIEAEKKTVRKKTVRKAVLPVRKRPVRRRR